jgi:hypothetical protein
MNCARAIRFAICCGVTPAAYGCAQIAGLTNDYQLAGAGAGGQAGSSGGAVGSKAGATGSNGGAAGSKAGGAGTSGGEAGAGGEAGSNTAGSNTGGAGSGGSGVAGSGGSGVAGSGGSGVAGSHAGSAGSGASGVAGSGGGSALGPVRVGFSEFHDSASGNDDASSHLTAASFAKPSGTAAGDLILVYFGADHSLSNLSGSELSTIGWTLLDQHADYGSDGQATYLIYKFASSAEPDPIVFNDINPDTSGNGVQGLLSVYRGVSPTAPINAYEVTVLQTGDDNITHVTTATPAITTTVANCLLIAGLSPDTTVDAPVITAWPSGFVEDQVSVNNPPHPYPYGWANIYSAERHLPTAGAVPASAFSWDTASGPGYHGSLSFVLALAP